jgi:hypothetical protein
LVKLLSLLILSTKRKQSNEPLGLFEFTWSYQTDVLTTLKQKAMDKKIVNKFKEQKVKEKEEKKSRNNFT